MRSDQKNPPTLSDLNSGCELALQALWHIERARSICEELQEQGFGDEKLNQDAIAALDDVRGDASNVFANCLAQDIEARATANGKRETAAA